MEATNSVQQTTSLGCCSTGSRVENQDSAPTVDMPYGKDSRYFGLIAYITSNAIAGEIMAVENYSEMVPLMQGTEAKIATVKQATEESKHIRLLSSLGRRLNFPVKNEIVEPQWLAIRRHFSEAARKNDLASCLIIQDLMTESMAIVLYRTLSRAADPDTSSIASTILKDEVEHLGIGIDRIKTMLEENPQAVHESLTWSHNRVMPELFSMVSTSCHSLCGELDVDCGGIGLDSIQTDIESIRIEALETYVETLDRVGFDDKVTTPLIASMASYGVQPRADLSLRSDASPQVKQACC